MTNEELLRTLLAESLQERGENAFSTRMLREQLESLLRFKNYRTSATHQFLVGARQARTSSQGNTGGHIREPGPESGGKGGGGGEARGGECQLRSSVSALKA